MPRSNNPIPPESQTTSNTTKNSRSKPKSLSKTKSKVQSKSNPKRPRIKGPKWKNPKEIQGYVWVNRHKRLLLPRDIADCKDKASFTSIHVNDDGDPCVYVRLTSFDEEDVDEQEFVAIPLCEFRDRDRDRSYLCL